MPHFQPPTPHALPGGGCRNDGGLVNSVADPITITVGNPNNQGTDNVLFNNATLVHSGLLVQGDFNGAGAGFIVDFTSASATATSASAEVKRCLSAARATHPFRTSPFNSKTAPRSRN